MATSDLQVQRCRGFRHKVLPIIEYPQKLVIR